MAQRRIGILGYDGIQALDLVGPAEAFAAVRTDSGEEGDGPPARAYDIVIIGLTGRRFVAETGLTLLADTTLSKPVRLDTLIIPGGRTMRTPATSAKTAAWIAGRAGGIRRIAPVCTGVYGLAPTGLLDGRRVTTHWRFASDLAQRFPKLRVEADALFIKDGSFYTSAGITAGIDLALAQIEEDHGPTAALGVARELVVYFKRPGGQQQFSEPLEFQLKSADRFADLTAWMAGHLKSDLSVEKMAARTFLGPRQFSRVFKDACGMTPAAFVEQLRLSEASRRLSMRRVSVDQVGGSVGYQSVDVFRRAFERRFGVSPGSYRSRFATGGAARTKTRKALALALALTVARGVMAQGSSLTADVRRDYIGVRDFFVRAAEKMPEAGYAFKPSPDVTTFAQQVAHVADDQYNLCAPARGETRKAAYMGSRTPSRRRQSWSPP